MTTYTLEARQAYDAASATRENDAYTANNAPLNDPGGWIGKECFALHYDRAHERFVYTIQLQAWNHTTTPNGTGRKLTDGFTMTVNAGATYDSAKYGNLNVAVKDIAAGTVTLYPTYAAGQNVPNGVHGSDGTWGYLSDAVNRRYTGPALVDPRTSNLWLHVFGDDNPCSIYCLEAALSYQQRIFPWTQAAGSTDDHMEPAGISDNYAYVFNEPYVLMSPRVLEAGELGGGYISTYAKYAMPFTAFGSTQFNWCFSSDNHMFVLWSPTGTAVARDYQLLRVDEPTSAPYGGPQVGGGVTDITPWTSSTGPNAANSDWQRFGLPSNAKLFDLRDGNLAAVIQYAPGEHAAGSTDPAYYRVDCTYAPKAGGSFDYHQGFIAGYMKGTDAASFQPATGVADADWAVEQLLEVDQDLNLHSYAFAGVDYATRTFFAIVQPVVGGAWTYNAANRKILVLTYHFVSGAAPACTGFIDGAGWDAAYAGSTGVAHPSYKVLDRWNLQTGNWLESGVWSPGDQAWWFMGADDFMATLDPSFAYEDWNGWSLPFVRFAVSASPPPVPIRRPQVWSTIGHPQL